MDLINCCRTCLSMENLNPIFKIPRENKQYSALLRIATGLKIEINDALPQSMCSDCIGLVNKFIEFRQQCYYNQIKLKNKIKYKLFNDTSFNNSNNDKVHDNINITNSLIDTCDKLQNNGTEINKIKQKQSNFILHNEKSLNSDNINSFIDTNDELHNNEIDMNKMKHKESNDILDNNNDKSSNSDSISMKSFNDSNDELQFNEISNKNPLDDKNIQNKEIESENCEEFEMTIEEVLKQHMHIEIFNYVPRKKVKLQYEETEIKEEREDAKDLTSLLQCKYCHKVMKTKSALNNHHLRHKGRRIVCEHCGKKFFSKKLLLMHCRGKHGYEKIDKCAFCDYKGSNAEQVKIHERLHTGERPYVCSSCGATFCRKSSYLQHAAIHLPEKTVPCPECSAWFKSATLMRVHRDRHRRRRKIRNDT